MKFLENSSSYRVSKELRKIFKQNAVKINEDLRKQVSILTTMNFDDYKLSLPRNAKEFLVLCCISWYLEEFWKDLLQLELLEKARSFGPDYEQKIRLLLTTEPEMICYLLDGTALGRTSREVFGNLLATQITIKFLTFRNRKPVKTQFKRGYRDKGSRVPIHQQHSNYKDSEEARLEQLKIEQDREDSFVSFQFWRGFCE